MATRKSRGKPPLVVKRDGFPLSSRSQTYSKVVPQSQSNYRRMLSAAPGTSFATDSMYTFVLKTLPGQLVRFCNNSLLITYACEYPNPDWADPSKPAPATAAPDADKQFLYCLAKTGKPKAYISPESLFGALFSKVEVSIDNDHVSHGSEIDTFQGLYSEWNRSCLTDEERRYLHDDDCAVLSTADRMFGGDDTEEKKKRLAKTLSTLDFENNTLTNRVERTVRCSLDGIPFLGYDRNNHLSKLHKKPLKKTMQFLPPDCEIMIRMWKQYPAHAYVESAEISDVVYFSDSDISSTPNLNDTYITDVKMHILNVQLEYETLVMDPRYGLRYLTSYKTRALSYVYDSPKISFNSVAPGSQVTRNYMMISKGTKLAYLGLAFSHMLWHNRDSGRSCSNKAVFPQELLSIKVTLDQSPMIADETLKELVSSRNYNSASAHQFYGYMKERDFTDKPFRHWFRGDWANDVVYQMMLPVEFSTFDMTRDRFVEITCEFQKALTLSPKNLNIVMNEVRQSRIRHDGKRWASSVIVR